MSLASGTRIGAYEIVSRLAPAAWARCLARAILAGRLACRARMPLMTLEGFPGGDLIAEGLRDLSAGHDTIPALVVLIGAPRLSALGLVIPPTSIGAEHRLYERLAADDAATAHARYNALIRRLVSFERAAACAG